MKPSQIPIIISAFALCASSVYAQKGNPTPERLALMLKKFPEADGDGDGILTLDEAMAYRDEALRLRKSKNNGNGGGPTKSPYIDAGWEKDRFPEHAACYKTPEQLKALYPSFPTYEKPQDGALRIVGTGHSFMKPGYNTLPAIVKAAGYADQPLHTHTSGGNTGSSRYKWEEENGIFQFEGRAPEPKLLSAIANGKWDVMMWGPYHHDRPEFYSCWMDFCEQYSPGMNFYLIDSWPTLHFFPQPPHSEAEMSSQVIRAIDTTKDKLFAEKVAEFRKSYGERFFIIPTSEALTLAVEAYERGELPGVDGLHAAVGKKEKHPIWRDKTGHLGAGFEWLEGYVFYATLYKKSPELIEARVGEVQGGFPSPELHDKFREIAWQAVLANPLSGVKDANGDGIGD